MKHLSINRKRLYAYHVGLTLKIIMLFHISVIFYGCDVHEYPDETEKGSFTLELKYEKGMTIQEYDFSRSSSSLNRCDIRYVIHAYPILNDGSISESLFNEFIFTQESSNIYDNDFNIELPKGEYEIDVWSDHIIHNSNDDLYYTHLDFSQIEINKEHKGSDNNSEAYRGNSMVKIGNNDYNKNDTLTLSMIEPLAKFEFVATNIDEFIAKSVGKVSTKATDISIDNYKIKFIYPGYFPSTYNFFKDKPVDAYTGVTFESSISSLNDDEYSLGFDYVFVNDMQSSILVQVLLLNNLNEVISKSEIVNVPLKRGMHTIIKGNFFMSNSDGGITINSNYDGEYNIFIP